MKKHRVLIGLTEVAGYGTNLKKGFEQHGVECNFISFSRLLFVWALINFDVFIFIYNSSFLGLYDLPILKLFKKKVIYVYAGSDSRPPYINGVFMAGDRALSAKGCVDLSKKMKDTLLKIERYADYIVDHPAMGHFHEKPFILGLAIGIPYSGTDITAGSSSHEGSIRILHAPSDPILKGSDKIRGAIELLRQKGYKIDYAEMTMVSHARVLEEISKCDFIVDQAYADTPMATFATEAAWLGKPAVVGSYYADHIHDDIPLGFIPPSLFCHPDCMADTIEKLVSDAGYRGHLGRIAMQYVRKNCDVKAVAHKYLMMIEGNVPSEWIFDPCRIRYVFGSGLPEKRVVAIIAGILEQYGAGALRLTDKPELEKCFTEIQREVNSRERP
jgi:hypothetical protein